MIGGLPISCNSAPMAVEPRAAAPPADSRGRVGERRSSFDPGVVLKTGASLVRQWRGHTHTVLVREDGFEYEGQRYRSLTVIAARFFGVSKRTRAS